VNERDDNGQQRQDHEAEEWHEHNRRLINEINEITNTRIRRTAEPVQSVSAKRIASPIDAYQQPF